jgi:hypothetical protein
LLKFLEKRQVFGPRDASVRRPVSAEARRRQPLESKKFKAPIVQRGNNHATLPRQRDCMSVLIQKCSNYCMLRQLLYSWCILDFLGGVVLACLFKHWRASIVATKSISVIFCDLVAESRLRERMTKSPSMIRARECKSCVIIQLIWQRLPPPSDGRLKTIGC